MKIKENRDRVMKFYRENREMTTPVIGDRIVKAQPKPKPSPKGQLSLFA